MSINVNRFNQNSNMEQVIDIPQEWSNLQIRNNHVTTGNVGYLMPIYMRELIPNQKVGINTQVALQFNPWVSNLFHRIKGAIKWYFVPYRLLDENWEDFIQGGVNGENAYSIPRDNFIHAKKNLGSLEGTLYDYFGYPINVDENTAVDWAGMNVSKYPTYAYNKIYNDHIRPIDVQQNELSKDNIRVQKCLWDWDYFTRARVYQQRGKTPDVPLSSEVQELKQTLVHSKTFSNNLEFSGRITETGNYVNIDGVGNRLVASGSEGSGTITATPSMNIDIANHEVALKLDAVGINLNDFLQTMAIMRVMMNNAKIKYRYIDFLYYRYGVARQDARLDLAEHLSTHTIEVTTQGIVQTSYGDVAGNQTPQGYITAQAMAQQSGINVNYECQEHGVIMAILEVKPETVYEGGLNAMWKAKNRFEFPMPELVNMPDVPIERGELFWTGTEADLEVFGYKGIFDEYRTAPNMVTGKLRPSTPAGLGSYTLARYFSTDNLPNLNLSFLQCNADMQRINQYTEEPDFFLMSEFTMNTAINLPLMANPAELPFA